MFNTQKSTRLVRLQSNYSSTLAISAPKIAPALQEGKVYFLKMELKESVTHLIESHSHASAKLLSFISDLDGADALKAIQYINNDCNEHRPLYLVSGLSPDGAYEINIQQSSKGELLSSESNVCALQNLSSSSLYAYEQEFNQIRDIFNTHVANAHEKSILLSQISYPDLKFSDNPKLIRSFPTTENGSKNSSSSDTKQSSNIPTSIFPKSASKKEVVLKAPSTAVSNYFTTTSSKQQTNNTQLSQSSSTTSMNTTEQISDIHPSSTDKQDQQDTSFTTSTTTNKNDNKTNVHEDEEWDDGTGYIPNKNNLKERDISSEYMKMNKKLESQSNENLETTTTSEINQKQESGQDIDDSSQPLDDETTENNTTSKKRKSSSTATTTTNSSNKRIKAIVQHGAMDDYFEDIAIANELERQQQQQQSQKEGNKVEGDSATTTSTSINEGNGGNVIKSKPKRTRLVEKMFTDEKGYLVTKMILEEYDGEDNVTQSQHSTTESAEKEKRSKSGDSKENDKSHHHHTNSSNSTSSITEEKESMKPKAKTTGGSKKNAPPPSSGQSSMTSFFTKKGK